MFGLKESRFILSLGVTLLLGGLITYYMRQRLAELDRKNQSMIDMLQQIAGETNRQNIVLNKLSSNMSDQPDPTPMGGQNRNTLDKRGNIHELINVSDDDQNAVNEQGADMFDTSADGDSDSDSDSNSDSDSDSDGDGGSDGDDGDEPTHTSEREVLEPDETIKIIELVIEQDNEISLADAIGLNLSDIKFEKNTNIISFSPIDNIAELLSIHEQIDGSLLPSESDTTTTLDSNQDGDNTPHELINDEDVVNGNGDTVDNGGAVDNDGTVDNGSDTLDISIIPNHTFAKMTVKELRQTALDKGVTVPTKIKKDMLIKLLSD